MEFGMRRVSAEGANRWYTELFTDLDRQPVHDLCMARHGSFGLVGGIDENGVRSSSTFDQFVALQGLCAPASTESGSNSINSASAAVASGFGTGSGFPSSR